MKDQDFPCFHDLLNPLAVACLTVNDLQQLLRLARWGELKQSLNLLDSSLKKMLIYLDLLKQNFSYPGLKREFSVNQVVEKVLALHALGAQRKKITLSFYSQQTVIFYGSELKFFRVIANLLANAIVAYEDFPGIGCRREVLVSHQVLSPRQVFRGWSHQRPASRPHSQFLQLKVQDWGCGIKESERPLIFSLAHKQPGKTGHGLGLYFTKLMVEHEFAGTIIFSSSKNNGTVFTVEIPLKKNLEQL